MLVTQVSKNLLLDLKSVIEQFSASQFSKGLDVLSNSSIGQHSRHILEFYHCLIEGSSTKEINYDLRKRNKRIESEPEYAVGNILEIIATLEQISDKDIILKFNNYDQFQFIPSSIERELVYNIEHAIHHMAIIQIAVKTNFNHITLPENFGIAPSTVNYHKSLNVHS